MEPFQQQYMCQRPKSTQNNSKVSIKEAGIPHFNGGGAGDEILNIIVDIPRHLTNEQKDSVKKFAAPDSGDQKKRFGVF